MSDVAAVRRDINSLERMLTQLARQNDTVIQNTVVLGNRQEELRGDVLSLRSQFEAFLVADRMSKDLQLAETRLVNVRQELEQRFGHYGEVRRMSTGVLQALDKGIVTEGSIQGLSEELMLITPQYWLSPAVVALAAWIRDDRALADKAVRTAMDRDQDKTALFLTLVTRRYQRQDASAAWLEVFLTRQDPADLDREFVVILDAVACGAFGPSARTLTGDYVGRWIEELSLRAGFRDEQVSRWRNALHAFTPPAPAGHPTLQQYAKGEWPRLQGALASAGLHSLVIDHFHSVFDGPLPMPAQVAQQVDEILIRLVDDFDTEELPLRRDEARLQLVIDERGDVTRADAQFATVQTALAEKNTLLGLITNAALFPERSGASRATQRLATAMSKGWLTEAHDQLTATSRAARPQAARIEIDGWSTTVGEGCSEQAAVADCARWVDIRRDQALANVKLTGGHIAAMVFAVLSLFMIGSMGMFAVLIAGGLGVYVWQGWKGLDRRREAVAAEGEARKASMTATLRACNAEMVELTRAWDRADGRAEEARELIASISPDQFSMRGTDSTREVAL